MPFKRPAPEEFGGNDSVKRRREDVVQSADSSNASCNRGAESAASGRTATTRTIKQASGLRRLPPPSLAASEAGDNEKDNENAIQFRTVHPRDHYLARTIAKLSDARKQLEVSELENNKLTTKNRQLQKQIQQSEQAHESLRRDLKRFEKNGLIGKDLEKLREEKAAYERDAHTAKARAAMLVRSIDICNGLREKERSAAGGETTALRTHITAMENEAHKHNAELAWKASVVAKLRHVVRKIARHSSLQDQAQKLLQSEKDEEISQLREMLRRKTDALTESGKQLEEGRRDAESQRKQYARPQPMPQSLRCENDGDAVRAEQNNGKFERLSERQAGKQKESEGQAPSSEGRSLFDRITYPASARKEGVQAVSIPFLTDSDEGEEERNDEEDDWADLDDYQGNPGSGDSFRDSALGQSVTESLVEPLKSKVAPSSNTGARDSVEPLLFEQRAIADEGTFSRASGPACGRVCERSGISGLIGSFGKPSEPAYCQTDEQKNTFDHSGSFQAYPGPGVGYVVPPSHSSFAPPSKPRQESVFAQAARQLQDRPAAAVQTISPRVLEASLDSIIAGPTLHRAQTRTEYNVGQDQRESNGAGHWASPNGPAFGQSLTRDPGVDRPTNAAWRQSAQVQQLSTSSGFWQNSFDGEGGDEMELGTPEADKMEFDYHEVIGSVNTSAPEVTMVHQPEAPPTGPRRSRKEILPAHGRSSRDSQVLRYAFSDERRERKSSQGRIERRGHLDGGAVSSPWLSSDRDGLRSMEQERSRSRAVHNYRPRAISSHANQGRDQERSRPRAIDSYRPGDNNDHIPKTKVGDHLHPDDTAYSSKGQLGRRHRNSGRRAHDGGLTHRSEGRVIRSIEGSSGFRCENPGNPNHNRTDRSSIDDPNLAARIEAERARVNRNTQAQRAKAARDRALQIEHMAENDF